MWSCKRTEALLGSILRRNTMTGDENVKTTGWSIFSLFWFVIFGTWYAFKTHARTCLFCKIMHYLFLSLIHWYGFDILLKTNWGLMS